MDVIRINRETGEKEIRTYSDNLTMIEVLVSDKMDPTAKIVNF